MVRLSRRALVVWLVFFGLYAATTGMTAFGHSAYAGDEPRYLLTTKSLVDDGDVNVFDDYRSNAYRSFYKQRLTSQGVADPARRTQYEPGGLGFPLLLTPAYKLGGARGVELFLAALASLAVALAYMLALRVVPDPWALGATLAVGVSPPLLAYSTTVYPELAAGALLAGAALLALSAADRPTRPRVFGCFLLLALLPWMSVRLVPAGLAVAIYAISALRRQRRGLMALMGAEIAGFSAALFVALNEGFYGGLTPYSALRDGVTATGADSVRGYAGRAPRLAGLFLDRDVGLLRWAPVLLLAFVGVWLLWRGHRERLAQAVPGYRAMAAAAGVCAAAIGAQLLVAAFVAPVIDGPWFPGRQLIAVLPLAIPLTAWGLRHLPRTGLVLSLLTLAASVWLYVDVRFGSGGLAAGRPDAPFGPLVKALPRFDGSTYPTLVAIGAGVILLALVWRDTRQSRRLTSLGWARGG
ncbi:MAG TPA: hypothetical protein VH817_04445 [Thermoleophilaceae bacterium]|jgi:hypothetical protein